MIDFSGITGRLDRGVADRLSLPRSVVKDGILSGKVIVNGKLGKPALMLTEGDCVSVEESLLVDPESGFQKSQYHSPQYPKTSLLHLYGIRLLYEDAYILVIVKPVGMVVHPAPGTTEVTVSEILSQYTTLSVAGSGDRPGIVHRLDKDTAGIMVLAKTDLAYQHLVDQFKDRAVEKHYYAVVRGNVLFDSRLLSYPIGRSLSDPKRQAVFPVGHPRAKPAESIVTVIKRYTTKTLVSIRPITGRMHQIRVHMAHIGHPVFGDPVYGPKKRSSVGQHLLAYRLGFVHPLGHRLSFELPLSVFEEIIKA